MSAKEEIKKEIGKNSAIEAVLVSEGGQLIVSSLKKDIVSCMDEIANKYKTSTHTELISLSARLSERLTLYRVLTGSVKRKKIAIKDLEDFLKENPEE
jgi:hypothetical protein